MPNRETADRIDRLLALERYRTLVEGSLQGICIYDESRIFFANRAMADMLGYTVDEMLAFGPGGVAGLVHPADRREVMERVAVRLTGKPTPQRVQIRLVRRDGSTVSVEGLIHTIACEGRPALFGSFADISPLHRLDSALRVISRGVASVTGVDALKALTRHLTEVLGASHALVAEFVPDRKGVARAICAVADGHPVPSFEYALGGEAPVGPDRAAFALPGVAWPSFPGSDPLPARAAGHGAAVPLEDEAGRSLGILAVANRREPLRDPQLARTLLEVMAGRVSAELIRERTAAALRRAFAWRDAIVEGAPDAIFISDASARFVTVNAAACELTGYTRAELLAMRIPELHEPEDLRAYRRFHSRIMTGSDAVTSAPIRRRDGSKVPVEFNSSRILVDDTPYMLTVTRDITERLEVEKELRLGRQRLHHLSRGLLAAQERERTRIAMELHDQLGQDLTALKLAFGAARHAGPPGEHDMELAMTLLDRIMEKVRTLSFELRPSTLDELGLAAALRGYVTRSADRAGLELRLSLDDSSETIPSSVETACFRIAQEAVTNVLRHAGAKRLSVRLRCRAGSVEVAVEDDGVGLPNGTSGNGDPTGLGIAGMHERAAAAGGRLTLRRRTRGGTSVRARFPLTPTKETPA